MHPRYNRLIASSLGATLQRVLDTPERYIEYRVLSRLGIPAIAAAVDSLLHAYPEIEQDAFAKQFCGSLVGEIMRRKGHSMVRTKAAVPNGLFSVGAVWSPTPDLNGV